MSRPVGGGEGARPGFAAAAKLSSQTSSRTVASASSLRCHVHTALVSLTIFSRPCPKLASRNSDRCADLWSLMNLQTNIDNHTHELSQHHQILIDSMHIRCQPVTCILESKAFPVASVANGDVHRALAVGLVVINPLLRRVTTQMTIERALK